jgi:ribosomal protein L11 methyltransferase
VAIRVPAGEAELAIARLLESFPSGIEEASDGETAELAVYTDDAGERELRAAFPDASSSAVDEGWDERWKEFHEPVRAGGLWIGPPWIERPPGEPAVVVDPGRAFGTGAHPTTRACIELLARIERGSLVDSGCGSGVVAVAAVRLGFAPVLGFDVDPVAVEVAHETARLNEVAIDVSRADALTDDLPSADVVVANIELRVVEALLARVAARTIVTAGYLVSDLPAAAGVEHVDRLELEGWAADVWAGRH